MVRSRLRDAIYWLQGLMRERGQASRLSHLTCSTSPLFALKTPTDLRKVSSIGDEYQVEHYIRAAIQKMTKKLAFLP